MIEILQSKRSQFYLFNINSLIILALAFCGVIISSTVYAKDIFNVELKCKGHDQEYCDIVKNSDNKTTFILINMRYPEVDKVNENIFHAYGSCGSPCQYHFFISKTQEDQTKEFIVIDKKNNCLIESDSKKNIIYARKLFNKNKKLIMNMHDKKYEHVIYSDWNLYSAFQGRSYFDQDNNLHLIAITDDFDKNGNRVIFEKVVNNPCEK